MSNSNHDHDMSIKNGIFLFLIRTTNQEHRVVYIVEVILKDFQHRNSEMICINYKTQINYKRGCSSSPTIQTKFKPHVSKGLSVI